MKPLPDKNTDPRPDSSEGVNASPPASDSATGPSHTPAPKQPGTSSLSVQVRTEPAPAASIRAADGLPIAPPQTPIPLAWLGIVAGPGATRGHTFILRAGDIIGRSQGNILLAGDATISSRHAQIKLERSQDGANAPIFVLYDLNSTNGTHVGTLETVSSDTSRVERHALRNGDYVLLGKTLLVFLQT